MDKENVDGILKAAHTTKGLMEGMGLDAELPDLAIWLAGRVKELEAEAQMTLEQEASCPKCERVKEIAADMLVAATDILSKEIVRLRMELADMKAQLITPTGET